MDINYAILGFLSWRSFSGYDLKKMFVNSTFIYWSGNNNQIYSTLLQLHRDGLVTTEMQHQESGPSRKMYTITDKGMAQLKQWVMALPEIPQPRNLFLVQLAWADPLTPDELDRLLERYENEINVHLLMYQEQKRRKTINPARTPRESYLWDMIAANGVAFYENELTWVRQLRQELVKNS
jgi:PadR family transcriptional regulator, regulatory protein AphA